MSVLTDDDHINDAFFVSNSPLIIPTLSSVDEYLQTL